MSDFTPGSTTTPLFGYSASLPWIRAETNIDGVNHWTKIIRNHTVKFGVDVRRVHDDLLQDQTSVRVEPSHSRRTILPSQARKRMSPTKWPASCWMFHKQSGAISTPFSPLTAWWFFAFAGDKWQVTPS